MLGTRNTLACCWILCFLILPMLSASDAQAQSPARQDIWRVCEPDPLAKAITPATAGPPSPDSPTRFTANTAQSSPQEAILEGDVQVEQGNQRLQASRMRLDRATNRITAQKGVIFGDPNLAVRSDQGTWDLNTEVGQFQNADYFLPSRHAQGHAESVTTDRNSLKSRFNKATYSTCQRGDELWQVRSRRLDTDENRGRGTARHLTLAIKDVPVLYFPYASFPINDERQSGFLAPTIGYGENNGLDLRIPYYWNIAPNHDMTITPRILSERGVMLGDEYRFLYPRHRGEIRGEFLPDDQLYGADRWAVFARHRASPISNLYTDLLYQQVSDDQYFNDLQNSLDLLNPNYLEQRWDAIYTGESWSALARVQNYQTLNPLIFGGNEPYSRYPQLLFRGSRSQGYNAPLYQLRTELVNFQRDGGVNGTRLDLLPTFNLPLQWPAGYITPRVSYRITAYSLQEEEATGSSSPSRLAPIASLDSGLFFERPLQLPWGQDRPGTLTLEPRLFYLYVPFLEQSDIPVFDSVEVDHTYIWLFLENSFTGADRLSNANQVTTAVTSRFLSSEGYELMRFDVGQIQYFADRLVTGPGFIREIDPTSPSSEIIGEARLSLTSSLALQGAYHWDPNLDATRRTSADLYYFPGAGRFLKASYRYTIDTLQQVDLSGLWPIGSRWRAIGRWNYSLLEERSIDTIAGVEYDECCWTFRLAARQRRDNPQAAPTNMIYAEFELKGLTSIGASFEGLLQDIVWGYQQNR